MAHDKWSKNGCATSVSKQDFRTELGLTPQGKAIPHRWSGGRAAQELLCPGTGLLLPELRHTVSFSDELLFLNLLF